MQMDVAIGDVEANRRKIVDRMRAATDADAQLVIFPECALTGYCFDSLEEAARFAEPIDGRSSEAIAEACRETGTYAVVGFIEKGGSNFYNAAIVVGPNGAGLLEFNPAGTCLNSCTPIDPPPTSASRSAPLVTSSPMRGEDSSSPSAGASIIVGELHGRTAVQRPELLLTWRSTTPGRRLCGQSRYGNVSVRSAGDAPLTSRPALRQTRVRPRAR